MPLYFNFYYIVFLISFLLYSLGYVVKFCWCLHDLFMINNIILKATVIPIKTAKTTNMNVNNIAIEIPTIEPIVVM